MIPSVRANGADIPAIGLGTGGLRGEAGIRAMHAALDCGYRLFDTAVMYGNESEVGEAVASHATPREEVFVTTKVLPADVADGRLQRSAEASLKRLRMDQVDLLLIHWPNPDVPFAEQIRALCDAKKRGLARHIGVSNFPPRYVEAAVALADELLVTNQVERHPHFVQSELHAVCTKHGLSLMCYAPTGRGTLLADPVITELARDKQKTAAQIVLRWHVQQPMNVAIPKSTNPRHIAENVAVFDFALTPEEAARITALSRPDGRLIGPWVPLDWDGEPA
jgi:2,5-diketo-D-gluconate reductase B